MNISLYEMTNDLVELMDVPIEEMTPEIKEEIMNNIMEMIKGKSENTIKYLRNMETRITALKAEEKRIKEYRQSEEKKYDSYVPEYGLLLDENRKGNILVEVKADMKSLDTNLGKICIRKAPASVEVNEEILHKEFFKEEIVRKVDKTYIKQLLKEGIAVEGARLVEDKYNLSVK